MKLIAMNNQTKNFPLLFLFFLKLKGALKILGLRKTEPLIPRMIFMGAESGECIDALNKIFSINDWIREWTLLGQKYETFGEGYEGKNNQLNTLRSYLLSTIYYRICEYLVADSSQRELLWEKIEHNYKKAGKYFDPPLEERFITLHNAQIPLYLRIPQRSYKIPCIVTLGGVDGVKEEWYSLSEVYTKNGWATLTFDLPGQGALRRLNGLTWRHDIENIISPILDFLENEERIDPKRIAIIGGSAGGYFALRSCIYDSRFVACGLISAPISFLDVYNDAPPPIPQTMMFNLGTTSKKETLEKLKKFNVYDTISSLKVPLFLVQGGKDNIVKPYHAKHIFSKVKTLEKFFLFEDGDHICFNHLAHWEMELRQWLASKFNDKEITLK